MDAISPPSMPGSACLAARRAGMRIRTREAARGRLAGLAAALGVVALFAGFVLVSRAGLRATLAPLDLLALRYAVAGVVMLPVFLRHRMLGLRPHQALSLALTGGLGFAAFAYGGFALAPASHGSALIHGTLPLSTLLIAWTCFGERGDGRRLFGAALIVAGALCLLAESLGGARSTQWLGDAMLLCASLCWSAYGILARRHGVRPLPGAALVAVLSALLFVPAYGVAGATGLFAAPWREVLWQALFQGVAIGVLSLVIYTAAVERMGAANTALFAAAAPALTTLLSIPLLDEHASPLIWLGVACVTSGIVVSALAGMSAARS